MRRLAMILGMGGGTRWTDELFSQLQDKGDPVADAVIEQHAAARPDARPVEIVQSIARHLVLPDEHRSDAVQAYLDDSPPLPEWSCEDMLKRGENFFEDNGLWIGMALFGASLPEAYSAARARGC